jgi:preprotein translocase subunit SecA
MPDSALSAPQLKVVDALLSGANLNSAADQAGVHRNTIAYWRHSSPAFEAALRDAQNERADMLHEEAVSRAALAFQVLEEILRDPKSSTSARLRAAIFILSHALPCPAKQRRATPTLPKSAQEPVAQEPATQNPDFVHKNAQIPQQPYRRPGPKTGRNDRCPCGSGKKFKQCCLNKPQTAVA